jgi:TRAP-type C4-dicarboxylate transport system permease small subunit
MQWSEVIAPPSTKVLRQFAGLFLIVFLGFAAWRAWEGHPDLWAAGLATLAVVVGSIGLIWPAAVRFIYTGWMIVAFPIGWTISHIVLLIMFYVIFAPIAALFRIIGRDELRLRRSARPSYWVPKPRPEHVREYFRQF